MQRATSRITGLLAAACCCLTLGAWGAPTSATSAAQCYATQRDPTGVVCYRTSWKAEFRHGDIVYVPRLVQVPTPSPPPRVTTVGSLDDIRPTGTG
ncbi:hypothetical protein ACIQVT_24140 [Streptomyces sp. NPDC100445]|uniref:hypothetical protein n=1 Tax=Streptomyces sp. NPDC100445 TaxID=3366102 RepID=UPI00382DEBE9